MRKFADGLICVMLRYGYTFPEIITVLHGGKIVLDHELLTSEQLDEVYE